MKCELCDRELKEKCLDYGKIGFGDCISRHHYFPKRLTKFFNDEEIAKNFDIINKNEKANLCYDCHEEMIHAIIITPKTIKKMKRKMVGKDTKERIIILYKQLLK